MAARRFDPFRHLFGSVARRAARRRRAAGALRRPAPAAHPGPRPRARQSGSPSTCPAACERSSTLVGAPRRRPASTAADAAGPFAGRAAPGRQRRLRGRYRSCFTNICIISCCRTISTALSALVYRGLSPSCFSNARFERDGSIVVGAFADHRGWALRCSPRTAARHHVPGPARARSRPLLRICLGASPTILLISDERTGPARPLYRPGRRGPPAREAAEEAFGGHRRAASGISGDIAAARASRPY